MSHKLPMAIAAQNLEELCNAVDEGEINSIMLKIFADARLDLAASVDRRILFIELAQERVATLKRLRDEFSAASKRLEYAIERVKKGTLEIMAVHPDLPYEGEMGRLRAQRNSSGKLTIEAETDEVTVRNIVDAGDIKKHAIDQKYYEARTYYTLLMDEIKKALESGEDIPWARLERGMHLRISR